MATLTRLDGQTLGFTTAGIEAVSVLSLNMSTGAITSSYLSDNDILNLAPAVSELFALVPAGAARNSAALQLLQRLVTVAPANGASLAQSATNPSPNVYTLVVTTGAAAYFIAHLPFSADGNLAWAVGIDVVGTGTVTAVTASSPLASSGGATPNISITSPLPTANGGTAVAATGASNGLFGVGGGVGGLTPLVSATRNVTTPGATQKQIDFQLKNSSANYTASMGISGQINGSANLANVTLSISGGVGFVFGAPDYSTSGRFFLSTNASGQANLLITDTNAGDNIAVLYGPGPGTDQLFLGGQEQLSF